jgi:hypothetical protein
MVFIELILTKLVKEVKMFEFEFEFKGIITNRLIRVTSLIHHDLLVSLLLDSSSCVSWLFTPSRAGPAYGLYMVDHLNRVSSSGQRSNSPDARIMLNRATANQRGPIWPTVGPI